MNNSRTMLSLITRTQPPTMVWLSRYDTPPPPLSLSLPRIVALLPLLFFPRRDACRCHYGSRRWGKVGAKLLNRRLRNQITDRDTTMPMHYLWPMPRASYTHAHTRSVEQAGWTTGVISTLIIRRHYGHSSRLFHGGDEFILIFRGD